VSVFSHAEIDYLGSQRLGRLATVGPDGMPHVVPSPSATTPRPTPSTSAGTTSPSARSSATSSGRAWRRWSSTTCSHHGSPAPSRCAAKPSRLIPAAKPSWRGSTTRSFGSCLAGSSPGASRTASRLVRGEAVQDRDLRVEADLAEQLLAELGFDRPQVGRLPHEDGAVDARKGREPVAQERRTCSYRPLSVSMPPNSPTHSMVRTSRSARIGLGPRWRSRRPASHSSIRQYTVMSSVLASILDPRTRGDGLTAKRTGVTTHRNPHTGGLATKTAAGWCRWGCAHGGVLRPRVARAPGGVPGTARMSVGATWERGWPRRPQRTTPG
jgi:hypothetical protein